MQISSRLNPHYKFDNYITTDKNRFAFKAALEVAEGRGKNYFPLYIVGENGTGKSHLLHAIGNHATIFRKPLNVVYMTVNDFVSEIIKAIRENNEPQLVKCFGSVDLLLLDDVHDLHRNIGIQQSLFHIHDMLLYSGKMLVVASNKPPTEILQLEDRIVTCFVGGVIAKIEDYS